MLSILAEFPVKIVKILEQKRIRVLSSLPLFWEIQFLGSFLDECTRLTIVSKFEIKFPEKSVSRMV